MDGTDLCLRFSLGVSQTRRGACLDLITTEGCKADDACLCLRFTPDRGIEHSPKPAGSLVDPTVDPVDSWVDSQARGGSHFHKALQLPKADTGLLATLPGLETYKARQSPSI